MTDVGEEQRLRPVDFRQGIGAPALLLESARAGKAGGNLAGQKFDEAGIAFIVFPVRVEAEIMQPTGFSCPLITIGITTAWVGDLSQNPRGRRTSTAADRSLTIRLPEFGISWGHGPPGRITAGEAG